MTVYDLWAVIYLYFPDGKSDGIYYIVESHM